MPILLPAIDNRRYAQLVDDTLVRAGVHTPEWTAFNPSDPGVTLVQLFAFLTENLLFRANQIPERNHAKFLQLLRVPLAAASAASGLVTLDNMRGAALTHTLPADLEVSAGSVPFRTQLGLDVLPLQAQVLFKRKLASPSEDLLAYYRLLYASYRLPFPDDVELYETVALDPQVVDSVDLVAQTPDQSLWVALMARSSDVPDAGPDPWRTLRQQLGGRTLTLGIVPALDAVQAQLLPGGNAQPDALLRFELPQLQIEPGAAGGRLPRDAAGQPLPGYRTLQQRTDVDLLSLPGVVQLGLPPAAQIGTWQDVDPLEGGVGEMPPALDDPAAAARVVTWLRVRAVGAARARIQWAGINAAPVRQVEHLHAEPLADGDGNPDQTRPLARAPVLPGTVRLLTRQADGSDTRHWQETDDLATASPEVPVSDPRTPGRGLGQTAPQAAGQAAGSTSATAAGHCKFALGSLPTEPGPTPVPDDTPDVFELDAEAGLLRFGDGLRGRRLPLGARVWASYDVCAGAAGNVAAGQINSAAQLPAGFAVHNPVQTWGGADAETVASGVKQVRRHLQHRDRLVSADDFEAIALRTPGVQIGRIEVLSAFHPDLLPSEPGSAPGVVTLLAIPQHDAGQPDAPRADRLFLNALCRHLDPRRLVTTELVLRGAAYKGIWISVGVDVAAGHAVAEVVQAVKQRLQAVLAPVGPAGATPRALPLFTPARTDPARGWPLRTAVSSRNLLAETARVPGVTAVAGLLLAEGSAAPTELVPMNGLELPQVLGISVVAGEPLPIDSVRGSALPADTSASGAPVVRRLPVPIVPESC